MEVGHFGDGVADLFVPLAGRGFAAVEMGDGELGCERGIGGSEHFETIAEEHDEIGLEFFISGGERGGGRGRAIGRVYRRLCTWGLRRRSKCWNV